MKSNILIIFALCAWAAALDNIVPFNNQTIDENTNDTEARIINGRQASMGQFPWQAGIFFRKDNSGQFCGGALIAPQWVFTAAHCVYQGSNFEVILGATRTRENQIGKIAVGVIQALYHAQYNPQNLNNDVALLQLSYAVQTNSQIQTIRLAPSNWYYPAGSYVRVSGWGKTDDQQNSIVNELNWVDLRTISNEACSKYYVTGLVIDSTMCCDGSEIKSICSGDSGGPVIAWANNQWYHVGVVSFVSSRGCMVGGPSGYARTASFIGFIRSNTGIQNLS